MTVRKFSVYVDESGQDTMGLLFVVGIVIADQDRDALMKELEQIEEESGKKNIKWHKSRPQFRERYIECILASTHFQRTLFYEVFAGSKQYLHMTTFATAKAILAKAGDDAYRATIYVDGLNRKEVVLFGKELRALRIQKKKVRGVRRDENNAFIRLADALCGLVRDARDGHPWARETLRALQKKKAVIAL